MEIKTEIQNILNVVESKIGRVLNVDHSKMEIALDHSRNNQALTIKVLSILGGILATLAFVVFLYVARFDKSQTALYCFSALFFILSLWMNKRYDKVLLDTISVCLYLLGYVLFGMATDISRVEPFVCHLLFSLFAIATLIISRSYILTFISVLIFTGSLIAVIFDFHHPDLLHVLLSITALTTVYFTLNEAKFLKINFTSGKRYQAIRTGLTFSYLICLYFVGRSLSDENWAYNYISSAILIYILMWLINCLLNRFHCEEMGKKIFIFIVVLVCLGFTAISPAISGSLLLLLLSFKVNYRTGVALGIMGFIYFIGMFYYDLNITLLQKSLIMFGSGVFFILLYFLIFKKSNSHEKA